MVLFLLLPIFPYGFGRSFNVTSLSHRSCVWRIRDPSIELEMHNTHRELLIFINVGFNTNPHCACTWSYSHNQSRSFWLLASMTFLHPLSNLLVQSQAVHVYGIIHADHITKHACSRGIHNQGGGIIICAQRRRWRWTIDDVAYHINEMLYASVAYAP